MDIISSLQIRNLGLCVAEHAARIANRTYIYGAIAFVLEL